MYAEKELIVTITQFDKYSVTHNKEISAALKKPYYTTNENYCYFLGEKWSNRWFFVPKGYATDGASVPELFQDIFPVWGPHGSAVIGHDFLCEYGYVWETDREGNISKVNLTRVEIDNLFIEMLRVIKYPEASIMVASLGFRLHRTFSNPPVPNFSTQKSVLENNLRAIKGIRLLSGAQVYDILNKKPEVYLA